MDKFCPVWAPIHNLLDKTLSGINSTGWAGRLYSVLGLGQDLY